MTPRVAIVGGGLAGLTVAHRLLARNVDVTVIDKGRRGGGRMCTRSVNLPDGRTARFDLGPPLLYARRAHDGLAPPAYRVSNLDNELSGPALFKYRPLVRLGADGEPAGAPTDGLAAAGGMRELAFRLLALHRDRLDFRDHTLAERLERTDTGWKVHTRSLRDGFESVVYANALVLTPPVPQTLRLLHQSLVTLPDDLDRVLEGVRYTRCIAVYGVFAGGEPLQPGGVWLGDGPFEWITDNHRKEVSDVPSSITALTTNEWATAHWEATDECLLEWLLPPLRSRVGEPVDPACVWVHRWQWAKPETPVRAPCAVVRNLALVLAGDGFAGSCADPADAAVVSGEAAALRTATLLTELVRTGDRYKVARPTRFTLEIAVTTADEAALAVENGADRLELSSGLEVGGLTPSMGLFRAVRRRVDVPVYVLLRPRPGGFVHTFHEFETMQADAEAFLAAGADGIVFGALTPGGHIDRPRCRELVDTASGRAVFHRAFDFLARPLRALDALIDLGFERVLTSGGASTAETGATRLAELVRHAGWRIQILPAGKILPETVADLVRETRCDQVHAAVRAPATDPVLARNPRLAIGFGGLTEMSAQLIRGLRQQLDGAADSLS
ncbi:MAG: NAD(P)-binding protein [Planctomycetes bacterium]|nr:NAD(P)-binding protein [Planctomycetota bacterium]